MTTTTIITLEVYEQDVDMLCLALASIQSQYENTAVNCAALGYKPGSIYLTEQGLRVGDLLLKIHHQAHQQLQPPDTTTH